MEESCPAVMIETPVKIALVVEVIVVHGGWVEKQRQTTSAVPGAWPLLLVAPTTTEPRCLPPRAVGDLHASIIVCFCGKIIAHPRRLPVSQSPSCPPAVRSIDPSSTKFATSYEGCRSARTHILHGRGAPYNYRERAPRQREPEIAAQPEEGSLRRCNYFLVIMALTTLTFT